MEYIRIDSVNKRMQFVSVDYVNGITIDNDEKSGQFLLWFIELKDEFKSFINIYRSSELEKVDEELLDLKNRIKDVQVKEDKEELRKLFSARKHIN